MTDNIIKLTPKLKQEDFSINYKFIFIDGEEVTYKLDSFGESAELKGFLVGWKSNEDVAPDIILKLDLIKRIEKLDD